MNPQQGPQQQPTPQSGGVPPVVPPGWQQSGSTPQATPSTQSPPEQQPAGFAPSGVPAGSYGIDYLNQIAPKEQRAINRFAVIALIGGVLISALFAVILMFNSGGENTSSQIASLSLRITTLQTVTTAQQKHLNETKIAEANAALNSSLTTMNTNIQAIIKERKIKTGEKTTAAKKEATYSAELAKTLDDSYQRGTLDHTYTSHMTYELTVLRSKLNKLKRSTKSKELTELTTNGVKDIDTILKAYESFDATKS